MAPEQRISMVIVVDGRISNANRVVQAAKRDGHSGSSRGVRDDDVDIIMEALCFCSLPNHVGYATHI